MNDLTKIRLGWKYRRQLWKYRGLIRRRKQIMAFAAVGAAVAGAALIGPALGRCSRDNE